MYFTYNYMGDDMYSDIPLSKFTDYSMLVDVHSDLRNLHGPLWQR